MKLSIRIKVDDENIWLVGANVKTPKALASAEGAKIVLMHDSTLNEDLAAGTKLSIKNLSKGFSKTLPDIRLFALNIPAWVQAQKVCMPPTLLRMGILTQL